MPKRVHLATTPKRKTKLETKHLQKHNLQPWSSNKILSAWQAINKACNNILPTFIDNKKYLFWPYQDKLNKNRFTKMHIVSGHEIFTVN